MNLPDFILNFKSISIPRVGSNTPSRWVNAFSDEFVGVNANHLYPTETLFGDWNGQILLLAQDALPAPSLKSVINLHLSRGDTRECAWRHADNVKFGDKAGWKTNNTLINLMKVYAPELGAVYGSAAAHMLYDDGQTKYSQILRGYYSPELQKHLIKVLEWVISNMPNLKYIMCLGAKSWNLVMRANSEKCIADYKQLRVEGGYTKVKISNKNILVIPAFHPAARVSKVAIEYNWIVLNKLINQS